MLAESSSVVSFGAARALQFHRQKKSWQEQAAFKLSSFRIWSGLSLRSPDTAEALNDPDPLLVGV